jgi:serine/threonine-protein kinase SRPK3
VAAPALSRHVNFPSADHIALIIELLGQFPKQVAMAGVYSRDIFNKHGQSR